MKLRHGLLLLILVTFLSHPVSADVVAKDPNARLKSFNHDIHGIGVAGEIKSCKLLVVLHADGRDGDDFYGGYCTLVQQNGQRKLVAICDDNMVGHFALYHSYGYEAPSVDADFLVSFVQNNCEGG